MTFTDRKVWFVTGSSSGLGRAMVEYVLGQGDRVVATLRKPTDISDLERTHSTDQLLIIKVDVVNPDEIKAAFSQALAKFGRIDVVYNNAGFAILGEIEGTPEAMARNMFEVNFWGATNVAREAVRVFRDVNVPRGGRLLQVSSMAGIRAIDGLGYYSATKHAVEAISQSIADEVHPSWNIKVTLLELGGIRTRALQDEGIPLMPQHPAYSDSTTDAARKRFMDGSVHKAAADVNKTVREIYKIAHDEGAGLRAVLGSDALAVVHNHLESVRKDAIASEQWNTDLAYEG